MTGASSSSPRVVFVATDLSGPADEAVRQAHRRAIHASARLIACHVVPNLAPLNMLFPHRHAQYDAARTELHARARKALVERCCALTGLTASDFDTVVDDGVPYVTIVEHAERADADLIVVGDRGATGLSRVLLGSVAERVVRYAHASVLVARVGPRQGRVLVATDLSDPSLPALTAASREARLEGAWVTAIHCIESMAVTAWPEAGTSWSPGATPDLVKDARERAHDELARALARFDLHADRRVSEGSPAACILQAAEELQVGLVIVGTRGRTGLRRVALGSVAESVVRHAHCSVLVVRHTDETPTATGG